MKLAEVLAAIDGIVQFAVVAVFVQVKPPPAAFSSVPAESETLTLTPFDASGPMFVIVTVHLAGDASFGKSTDGLSPTPISAAGVIGTVAVEVLFAAFVSAGTDDV